MYIVIGGAGQVGYKVAETLCNEGHDVSVIEKKPEICERMDTLDVLVVKGNAGSEKTLLEAGIEKADLFIGVTGSDETNMIGAIIAKTKGCKTICRINSPDYINEPVTTNYRNIGIDVGICPDLVTAIKISRMVLAPTLLDADVFAKGAVQVLESNIEKNSPVANKPIKDIGLPEECNIVAVFRGIDVIIPDGNTVLAPNDRIVTVLGNQTIIQKMKEIIGGQKQITEEDIVKRVIIIGATRIGVHLAHLLEDSVNVTLIDSSEQRCENASKTLSKATVINGDETDRDVLAGEGIERVDVLVAANRKDEVNMLSCLLAKEYGAKKIIALIDRTELKSVLRQIAMTVSPNLTMVSGVLRYAKKTDLASFKVLKEGEAQVLEYKVSKKSKLVDKKIKKANFPGNSVVGAIARNGKVIIPSGEEKIMIGDRLIVFARTDTVPKLERLLA